MTDPIIRTEPTTSRNLAAEVRWLEEGHHIHLDPEAHSFWTRSDTTGRRYDMEAHALCMGDGSWPVAFGCNCPAGVKGAQAATGQTKCKHTAGLARRLEREGLARWTPTRWEATELAVSLVEPEPMGPVSSTEELRQRMEVGVLRSFADEAAETGRTASAAHGGCTRCLPGVGPNHTPFIAGHAEHCSCDGCF